MSESVIFNSPLLLAGYGIALLLCLFSVKGRIGGYVLPIISAFVCVLTTTYALLQGADLYEAGMVIVIFLLINLSVYQKGGEK